MRLEDARRVLGVAPGASEGQVRAAYHGRLRQTHPDLAGGSSAAAAEVVEAYRTVLAVPAQEAAPTVVVDGDTVAAELPAGDLFDMLLDVAASIGSVSYADPESGLLEIVVHIAGYGPCSVVLTLQGRATGMSEAWCTVETFNGGERPPASAVAELLAAGLRQVAI